MHHLNNNSTLAKMLCTAFLAMSACVPIDNEDGGDDGPSPGPGPGTDKTIHVTSVSFDRTEVTLNIGGVDSIDYFIEPEDAADKSVTWETSDPAVVMVDEEGSFTATGPGTAVITLRTNDGGKTATCQVTVRKRLFDTGDYGGGSDDGKCRYKYGSRTIVLDDDTAGLFFDVSKDGFSILDADLGGSPILAGDVFVFPESETFPEGYAAVVKSTEGRGDDDYKVWIIHTATATLEEVFEELCFSTVDLDLGDKVEQVTDEEGNDVPFYTTKASVGFQIHLPTALGIATNINLGDNCTVTPDFTVGFKMTAECDLSWHSLNKFITRINNTAKMDVGIAIKASGSQNIFKSRKLNFILGAVPIGPVTLHPVITAKFNIDLTGEVSLTTSLHSYIDEFFEVGYTKEKGVYSEYGELPEPEPTSALSVTGALSGGISLGPDLGLGLSIWAGALQLTLELQPRLNGTFNCSLPFNKESLVNLMSGAAPAEALAQAFFEASVSVGAGGSFDYGWTGSKGFKFPASFSYSIGKLYLIPSLDPVFSYTIIDNNVQFITAVKKQSSIYDNNIFIELEYQDRESPGSDNFVTRRIKVPMSLEDGRLVGNATNLPRGTHYTIAGPKIGINAFDMELDLLMYPVQTFDRFFYIDEPADYPLEELRPILKDIIASVPDFYMTYPDCNWEDPDAVNFWQVQSSRPYDINEVRITLPVSYSTGDWRIHIGKHSTSFNWRIQTDGKLKELVIDDDRCSGISAGFAQNGLLAVHSKALTDAGHYNGASGAVSFIDENFPTEIDLSRSGITEAMLPSCIPTIKLDNCTGLRELLLNMVKNEKGQFLYPVSLSANGVSLVNLHVKGVTEDKLGFINSLSSRKLTLTVESPKALSVPPIADNVFIGGKDTDNLSITVPSSNRLESFELYGHETVITPIKSLSISGCPNLKNVSVGNVCESLNIPRSDRITLSIEGEGPLPEWTYSYSTSGVKIGYRHKYTYNYDYELVGQDSSDSTKNVYKRTYKGYTTAPIGLYYPWEPGRGYHCNSHYFMENSEYPNDRSDKTNQ